MGVGFNFFGVKYTDILISATMGDLTGVVLLLLTNYGSNRAVVIIGMTVLTILSSVANCILNKYRYL